MVRESPIHYSYRGKCDQEDISIFSSRFIRIDHCVLYNCMDGLIDTIMGSTTITISNINFHYHNEVSSSILVALLLIHMRIFSSY
ncbi:hypothetical protein SUGI_0824770 [Cryptomeria japonica]|nr:hypothetical protein SUGI_0824770 [Cryptomeria japonica]